MQSQILDDIWLGNPIRSYLWCLLILLSGFIVKRLLATFISRQSFRFFKKFSQNKFSEEFVSMVKTPFEQLLTLLILFFAFDRLSFPEEWNLTDDMHFGLRWAIDVVFGIALIVVITRILLRSADYFSFALSRRENTNVSPELANFLNELIKVVLIVLACFAGLRFIFSINITALIASLGIGGLAVALAAQDTLANLLGSFIIYLDKPFKVGDLVEFGDTKGTVEHVGFRTTRIRTLEKSLLIVPNKKVVDSILNNITMSEMRRVKFNIGLTYNSSPEQIKHIITDIHQIIAAHPKAHPDITVRFTDFDSSSLNILVLFFVYGNDYDEMIDVKEDINLKIMHVVASHGAQFAYPTQTVYLQKNSDELFR
jgi:MscS family membrane protein